MTRKRFVKLMMGKFGYSKRAADTIADGVVFDARRGNTELGLTRIDPRPSYASEYAFQIAVDSLAIMPEIYAFTVEELKCALDKMFLYGVDNDAKGDAK